MHSTDDATKPKKSYGSHIKANFKENTILLCFKIGLEYTPLLCFRIGLHYSTLKNTLGLTTLLDIFKVKLHIRQINIRI